MVLRPILAVAVLACGLTACAPRADDARVANPAPTASLDPRLRTKQAELVAYDRSQDERRRAAIAKLAAGSARDVTAADAQVERFQVTVRNRGTRPIRRIDGGVTVYDAATFERLGLSTFSAAVDIKPGSTRTLAVAIPMVAFAEGAGRLARTAGKPKTVELDVTGVGFGDGRETGERD